MEKKDIIDEVLPLVTHVDDVIINVKAIQEKVKDLDENGKPGFFEKLFHPSLKENLLVLVLQILTFASMAYGFIMTAAPGFSWEANLPLMLGTLIFFMASVVDKIRKKKALVSASSEVDMAHEKTMETMVSIKKLVSIVSDLFQPSSEKPSD